MTQEYLNIINLKYLYLLKWGGRVLIVYLKANNSIQKGS